MVDHDQAFSKQSNKMWLKHTVWILFCQADVKMACIIKFNDISLKNHQSHSKTVVFTLIIIVERSAFIHAMAVMIIRRLYSCWLCFISLQH